MDMRHKTIVASLKNVGRGDVARGPKSRRTEPTDKKQQHKPKSPFQCSRSPFSRSLLPRCIGICKDLSKARAPVYGIYDPPQGIDSNNNVTTN